MNVAALRYNAGNLESVRFALARMGIDVRFTESADELRAADRVIFPGVGEASSAMAYLEARGLASVLAELRQPVLGICLGLQLLCAHSEEGNTKGLGVFSEPVERFRGVAKVPHVGWNSLTALEGPLFEGVAEGSYVYFVHSYRAPVGPDTVARCGYGAPFSAALRRGNFAAVQFHPEKSGSVGQRILENFIRNGV